MPLITVASQQLLVGVQDGLQTCTVAFIVLPVPVLIAQVLLIHPLPATRDVLTLQTEPKAVSFGSSGIEECEVLLFFGHDSQVHIMPLTEVLGSEPGHRSVDQEVLRQDLAHRQPLAHHYNGEKRLLINSFTTL